VPHKGRKRRWTYRHDRLLLELASGGKSLERIASEIGQPPELVRKMSIRLGLKLKLKAKGK
jgi:hypothetical protein